MLLANADPELTAWILDAAANGGSFVAALATAALHADADNYALLRPALLTFRLKYPRYGQPRTERAE